MRTSPILLLLAAAALAGPVEDAADQVLAAFRVKDAEALKALSTKEDSDPWVVADELCARGEFDAAEAFARAVPRRDTERLPAHVASLRGKELDAIARNALATANAALAAGDWATALESAPPATVDGDPIVSARLRHARGLALRGLRRFAESVLAFDASAEAARALGWWAREELAIEESGRSATLGSDYAAALVRWRAMLAACEAGDDRSGVAFSWRQIGIAQDCLGESANALGSFERALALLTALGDRSGVARILVDMGLAHDALGDYPKALACQERALATAEELGDRATMAIASGNLGALHRTLGDYPNAIACQERSLALNEELGNRAGMAAALGNLGIAYRATGDYRKSIEFQERSLAIKEGLGDRAGMANSLTNLGNVHGDLGDFARALTFAERALALNRELGNRRGVSKALGSIGSISWQLGDFPKALEFHEQSLALKEELGDRIGVARTLGNMALVYGSLGDYPTALAQGERALKISEEIGDREGVAWMLDNLGSTWHSLGDHAKALSFHERSLKLNEELGDTSGMASTFGNLAKVYDSLGDFPKAFACHERSVAILEKLGDKSRLAGMLINLGSLHLALGDSRRAISVTGRALALAEEVGDRVGVANALLNLGNAQFGLTDYRKAIPFYERALAMNEGLGNRAGVARTLGNLGACYGELLEHEKALSCHQRALALWEEIGDRDDAANTLGNTGATWYFLRDYPRAIEALSKCVEEMERLHMEPSRLVMMSALARARLAAGDAPGALAEAKKAIPVAARVLGGLGDEQGATSRGRLTKVFRSGALAAARLSNVADTVLMLENCRAGALLEMLGGRRAMAAREIPEDLRRAETEARKEAERARREHERALSSGDPEKIARAAKALDDAFEHQGEVVARIHREAKRAAGLLYPRAATVAEIRGCLHPGEALVLYGLCIDEALAVVLTPDSERIAWLGATTLLITACEAARAGVGGAARGLRVETPSPPVPDATAALELLRMFLVDQLALPDTVKVIIVSPEDALCSVPWGAILNRPVACVPSGSVLATLRGESPERGEKVLALGDPDYGDPVSGVGGIYVPGDRLDTLPGTREEAIAVGDVTLLGAEATEPGLAAALAKERRWRAVHFACHGFVNPDRPDLSALALSRSADSDGFLTSLEVLRMALPADLAVLSACETARGKVVLGEGIVGLTRAFTYAGAPRVLCSLWKVDDEATKALMVRFYELWNPEKGEGLPAAKALREAQNFVRAREVWRSPEYWAAWQLWGLPE